MPYKNALFYGFWLLLTILLAYWFSYPLDIFSGYNYFGGNDATPNLWVLNWQLTQLSSGNFDQLFTGNSFYPLDRPIYFNVSTFSTALFTLPVFLATKDPYIRLWLGESSRFSSFIRDVNFENISLDIVPTNSYT